MLRSRIAPTPSGYLHIGNAINFVLTWLWVRRQNGTLRLRIDDLDTQRNRPEYLQDIFKTLDWLGLTWDEGPQTLGQHQAEYAQQLFKQRYDALIDKLIATGKVFASATSRSQIAGGYTGATVVSGLPLNAPDTSLRIITPNPGYITVPDVQAGNLHIDLHQAMPNFTIRRRDGLAAYQITSLADDVAHNINFIIRGNDLATSTAAQLYLAKLAGNTTFAQCQFYHHPLITNANGTKLSKSAGSPSLKAWRENNRKPSEFYQLLSGLLGWKQQATSATQMLQQIQSSETLILPRENLII